MDESTGARLELTGARVRSLLGRRSAPVGDELENANDPTGPPCDRDVALLAERIAHESDTLRGAAAVAAASDIVLRATAAIEKLEGGTTDAALTDDDALALESVMQVRGRPAVRVVGQRLEPLDRHPGSDLWQLFIADYEQAIVDAAASTGAVVVIAPETANQPWLQGSAWVIGRNRVVTNRHVLLPPGGVPLIQRSGPVATLRADVTLMIDFAADDRILAETQVQRRVCGILYLAAENDPVDVAVLEVEPLDGKRPLELAAVGSEMPRNIFVVGHPGLAATVPSAVAAVFGRLDGRKRVSFGKRQPVGGRVDVLGHDASTVGGYSGGPVVSINGDAVVGLHYYGDPVNGNLALAAATLRAHPAYALFRTT